MDTDSSSPRHIFKKKPSQFTQQLLLKLSVLHIHKQWSHYLDSLVLFQQNITIMLTFDCITTEVQ